MNTNNLEAFSNWIGKEEVFTDYISSAPIWGFYDVLNIPVKEPQIGDPIPLGSHWCFFLPHVPMNKVGPDGHPKRGSFMPNPPDLPRRMFAGSHLIFHNDIIIGNSIKKIQTIKSISPKIGKSGKLLFVQVEEKFYSKDILSITQINDIVYRESPKDINPKKNVLSTETRSFSWNKEIKTNSVMLFKYSAITFNGHRIHYDLPYVTTVEKYPGLVVHGPLTATLLMNLCEKMSPSKKLIEFKFKAISPLFNEELFTLKGEPKDSSNLKWNLWAENNLKELCMEATALFA